MLASLSMTSANPLDCITLWITKIFLSIRNFGGLLSRISFHNVVILKILASLFLAIIPKVDSSLELGDFRFISLRGLLYKLVA